MIYCMANITQLFLTKNNCYISNKKHVVKGVMWHSTGANNPYLSRYVGPDDGKLGLNKYNNHWNQSKPGGKNVCVHAFIGYLKDKNGVAIYQTLPWDIVGWHSGVGSKGSNGNANNNGYIGFEICQDSMDKNDKKSKEYFELVYEEGIRLTVKLFKDYNLKVSKTTLLDHSEGYKLGIASNHSDISHWLRKFGKSMDDVRAEVSARLSGKVVDKPNVKPVVNNKIDEDGKWGNATTKKLQEVLGTTQDGVISKQVKNSITDSLYGKVTYGKTGSTVIKALQKLLGVSQTGLLNSITVRELQKYLGTVVDGKLSRPSLVVKEMQKRLNNGTFLDVKKGVPKVENKSTKKSKSAISKIDEDGKWGNATTKRLQEYLGTIQDGIISNQLKNSVTNALYGKITYGTKGSLVVKELQRKIGAPINGRLDSVTIRVLQRYLRTVVDGKLSRPSLVVKEMQKRLNNNNL